MPKFKELGANLVAISVENPDKSLSVAKKNALEFSVLSDPNLDVARKFGLVFTLPPATDEQYKKFGVDLVKLNGTAKPELPISATYVISQKGKIAYAFLDPDYTKRGEPDEIVKTLTSLKPKTKMRKKKK